MNIQTNTPFQIDPLVIIIGRAQQSAADIEIGITQAATILKTRAETVRRWVVTGVLPGRIPKRGVAVRLTDLLLFVPPS